ASPAPLRGRQRLSRAALGRRSGHLGDLSGRPARRVRRAACRRAPLLRLHPGPPGVQVTPAPGAPALRRVGRRGPRRAAQPAPGRGRAHPGRLMTLGAPRLSLADLVDLVEPRPVPTSEVALRGRVWDVRRDTVDLGEAGTVTREYVDHPGAVAVLALREDRGLAEVLLIQQYRHPVGAFEWELPAGLLDVDGEPPVVAAARELTEEADLR